MIAQEDSERDVCARSTLSKFMLILPFFFELTTRPTWKKCDSPYWQLGLLESVCSIVYVSTRENVITQIKIQYSQQRQQQTVPRHSSGKMRWKLSRNCYVCLCVYCTATFFGFFKKKKKRNELISKAELNEKYQI